MDVDVDMAASMNWGCLQKGLEICLQLASQ